MDALNTLILDIGTSSMRAILFTEEGRAIASHQIQYHPQHVSDVIIEQDIDDFKRAMIEIVSFIAKDHRVDALTLTSQRSSIVPVDQNGYPLMNTIMWQDRRNREICEELSVHNDMIKQLSGANVNTVFSGSKMTWIKRHCPAIAAHTHKFVNIPEYLIHYLTGNYVTDVTYGSRSHLMNLRTCDYDDRLLDLFGIKREELCDILEVGSICGTVLEDVALQLHIPAGIPVITAGGDQQCAAIGNGACYEGTLSLVEGTGAFLITQVDHCPDELADNVICNCASVPGAYTLETNVLTCGSAFDWCRHLLYGSEADQYDLINRELQDVYDQETIVQVLPYFQGRSTPMWNPLATATFNKLSLSTTRAELFKALLEGIFIELNANIEELKRYVPITEATISGGMTRSWIINQMQADVFGMPLTLSGQAESTARGALIVSLVTLGRHDNVKDAYDLICGEDTILLYMPDEQKHQQYLKKMWELEELYNHLYDTDF